MMAVFEMNVRIRKGREKKEIYEIGLI